MAGALGGGLAVVLVVTPLVDEEAVALEARALEHDTPHQGVARAVTVHLARAGRRGIVVDGAWRLEHSVLVVARRLVDEHDLRRGDAIVRGRRGGREIARDLLTADGRSHVRRGRAL